MIETRRPGEIHQAGGEITGGKFTGRWHFSFGSHVDPGNTGFGRLRVFNDDTLSPGATWPMHPHKEIEVVTYCAGGEFRHADERGEGGILRKGDVQHSTVGRGMYHSEINVSSVEPMRFIQMWFIPREKGLEPSVEQTRVRMAERKGRLLPLVSGSGHEGLLEMNSDAAVYASFMETGTELTHELRPGRGAYLYVVEGGPVTVNGVIVEGLGAARVKNETPVTIVAEKGSELLLVDTAL